MDTQPPEYYKILLIGDSCIDRYHYGECSRLSPEAPVPVLRHVETAEEPGMALNVKENLKAFPVEVDIITNSEHITKERFVDIKSKQHMLRCDFGENKKLNPMSQEQRMLCDFSLYDAVILSDYDKGFLSVDVIKALMRKKDSDTPIFVDTKKRDLSVFSNCFIKINELEYGRVLNKGTSNDIIVTLGQNGAKWKQKIFPTKKVEVFDVSGAGDTFLASLVYGFIKSDCMETSLKFANKCASVVVKKSGTYALTEEDLVKNDICL